MTQTGFDSRQLLLQVRVAAPATDRERSDVPRARPRRRSRRAVAAPCCGARECARRGRDRQASLTRRADRRLRRSCPTRLARSEPSSNLVRRRAGRAQGAAVDGEPIGTFETMLNDRRNVCEQALRRHAQPPHASRLRSTDGQVLSSAYPSFRRFLSDPQSDSCVSSEPVERREPRVCVEARAEAQRDSQVAREQ
jgi:hypothetical protein